MRMRALLLSRFPEAVWVGPTSPHASAATGDCGGDAARSGLFRRGRLQPWQHAHACLPPSAPHQDTAFSDVGSLTDPWPRAPGCSVSLVDTLRPQHCWVC